jgi:hypothetical protein
LNKQILVSDVARRFNVPPRMISDLFYARKLDDQRCPIVGGRRLIPEDYLPAIAAALRELGVFVRADGDVGGIGAC